MFLRTMTPLLKDKGICVASSGTFSFETMRPGSFSTALFLKQKPFNVFVYYGERDNFYFPIMFLQIAVEQVPKPTGKVWVIAALWDLTLALSGNKVYFPYIQVFLSFLIQRKARTTKDNFQARHSAGQEFVRVAFDCFPSKPKLSVKAKTRCKERETLKTFSQEMIEQYLSLDSYRIYNAVQVMARTLNAAYSSRSQWMMMVDRSKLDLQWIQPWQVLISPTYHRLIQRCALQI